MAEVRFEGVTKRFGATLAVSNLDLVVADREFLVLVGPSGCGKSTILRLLAGLEELTSGDIYIGERLVNDVAAKDRDIAMVFQSYALYPHMSVFDNMAFGLSLRRVPRNEIRERVEEAAHILGIRELLDRKPKQLSGGQRQRVALGRAIVRDPAVFLLDEPLSNLDAKLRVQTRAEISKLHQRLGSTFVYVTHDQTEAMTMADRIAVLREGILQQVGRPQELYDAPRNVFVAGFIGSPAMNMFKADVSVHSDGATLRTDGVSLEVTELVADRLTKRDGQTVLVGVRPEDLHDPNYQPPGIEAARFAATVDLTEPMGNEVFLHLVAGEERLLARVDPRTSAAIGETVDIAVDASRLHVFDPETEMSLTD